MAAADDDVTRFAELLARLKARTDRSYAALARRLDMNASTLHRYCAGEAVPLDFGVVERFAALCGASPQERVELHRLWILAVAERRRSRPAAARPRPTSTGEPGVPEGGSEGATNGGAEDAPEEPGTTPARRDAPAPHAPPAPLTPDTAATRPAADGAARTPEDPQAHPAPDRLRTSDTPLTPPAPAGAAGPQARPAPDTAPAPDPAPGTPGAGGRPSGSWYRRRPAVVSAVLGSVFVLTAAGFAAFSGFPGFSAGGSPGGGASPRRGPSAPTTDAPAGPSTRAVPFTWTVNSHVWEGDCGHDYVIGEPPDQVPPPPSAQDAEVWANAQDAVHGGETTVRVAVQGRTEAAVVLEALHVRVVRRATPPGDGAFVYDTGLGCGGGDTPRAFTVNLDAHTPLALAVPGSKGGEVLPTRRLPYRVSVEDPEVLVVEAGTEHCACEWYLDLDWSSQGSTGTVRIDDHGRPFRTSGITRLPIYKYADPPGQWTPKPARN
ncbi:helix-turn-helix domain-containing protein [Streptomyces sp. NPDC026665]|uniref:helix-turn-helix domain-containing protein n=1 Tax=Streptomyces sp. NPDC026665 TaxID=3154798 RepID=UPI0033F15AF7